MREWRVPKVTKGSDKPKSFKVGDCVDGENIEPLEKGIGLHPCFPNPIIDGDSMDKAGPALWWFLNIILSGWPIYTKPQMNALPRPVKQLVSSSTHSIWISELQAKTSKQISQHDSVRAKGSYQ